MNIYQCLLRGYIRMWLNFVKRIFVSIAMCCQAEAEMAYELQAAKTKQRIKEEQMQIAVVERTQEIEVQKWEVQRREKELDATVRR